MVNSNGNLVPSSDAGLSFFNRGFSYGDALFETVKAVGGKLLFWEDHYFRLMASMRLLRMEIPMTFTPEYFADQFKQNPRLVLDLRFGFPRTFWIPQPHLHQKSQKR